MNVENKLEYYENCYIFNHIVCFVYLSGKNRDCKGFGGKFSMKKRVRGENSFDRRGVKV